MKTWIPFNLNSRVRVTLNEQGVEQLRKIYPALLELKGDVWETQMWVFIQAFGGLDGPTRIGFNQPYDSTVQIQIEIVP